MRVPVAVTEEEENTQVQKKKKNNTKKDAIIGRTESSGEEMRNKYIEADSALYSASIKCESVTGAEVCGW